MTYDELLDLMTPSINKLLQKYKGLSTEYEDLYQEACILLFEKMEKLNSISEDKQKIAYFKVAFEGKLKDINIKEHMNMSRKTITYFKDESGEDKDIFDVVQKIDIEYQYIDEFLEHVIAVRRECSRRWREKNPERYREILRNYYHRKGKQRTQEPDIKEYLRLYKSLWRKKNEEHVKEYRKCYYQKNKEKEKEYQKKYYEKHKEEISSSEKYKEYQKQYYQEHKEEINTKRKEYMKKYHEEHKEEISAKRRQKRLERKNKNNE